MMQNYDIIAQSREEAGFNFASERPSLYANSPSLDKNGKSYNGGLLQKDKMPSGIYQLRNTVNGKCYIGSTKRLVARKSKHLTTLREGNHDNAHLQNAANKYGGNSLMFEVLLLCDPENLLLYEQMCIDCLKPEYNICPTAGNCLGVRHTEESKRNMSVSKKGIRHSEESRRKMSIAMKGNTNPKGHVVSEETRKKISASETGCKKPPHTEEWKRKISKMQKGRKTPPRTEEWKRKQSEAQKGHKTSDETRRRISEAQKARWDLYGDGK